MQETKRFFSFTLSFTFTLHSAALITMVKLARIQTKSGRVVLAARVAASSFQSPDVTSDHQLHYVDLSSIASSARAFILEPKDNIARANILINNVTSPDAQLSDITKNVIFSSDVKRILSPLDGAEVNKFICIGMNYVDHCAEQNLEVPKVPLVFSKVSILPSTQFLRLSAKDTA